MLDKVANILLNPKFVNFANNTKYTVSTESIFKATGRPAAIMMDKNVDEDTRKYAATKEGLYQMLCLGIYLTMIPFIFQRYGSRRYITNVRREIPCMRMNNIVSEGRFFTAVSSCPTSTIFITVSCPRPRTGLSSAGRFRFPLNGFSCIRFK